LSPPSNTAFATVKSILIPISRIQYSDSFTPERLEEFEDNKGVNADTQEG
jgi:hypothetical protein